MTGPEVYHAILEAAEVCQQHGQAGAFMASALRELASECASLGYPAHWDTLLDRRHAAWDYQTHRTVSNAVAEALNARD